MRLASHLHKSLDEIFRMSPREWALWIVWLEEHDPEERADLRAAMIASIVINVGGEPEEWTVADQFLGAIGHETQEEEAQPIGNKDLELTMAMWTFNAGGEIVGRK